MTVFFVGAGASWGTLRRARCCPPIATRFGASLASVARRWERQYPGLSPVVKHIGLQLSEVGLERLWTCIDYYAKLQAALPSARWSKSSRTVHDLKGAMLR